MGVVNVTPDSFSDGGEFVTAEAAIAHGQRLRAQGADILDVGGEATNPWAEAVTAEVELARVLPVIAALANDGATVSIDTTKAAVARAAVEAGATIINDISGGLFDPEMGRTAAELATGGAITYIAGHLRGHSLAEVFSHEGATSLRTSSDAAHEGLASHVIGWQRVAAELADRLAALPEALRQHTWVDPGIGFGKGSEPEDNLELIRHAGDIGRAVGRPVVIGASRKRFLRKLLSALRRQGDVGPGPDADPLALDVASVAAHLGAVRSGALVVRAHNVALLRAALAVYTKI